MKEELPPQPVPSNEDLFEWAENRPQTEPVEQSVQESQVEEIQQSAPPQKIEKDNLGWECPQCELLGHDCPGCAAKSEASFNKAEAFPKPKEIMQNEDDFDTIAALAPQLTDEDRESSDRLADKAAEEARQQKAYEDFLKGTATPEDYANLEAFIKERNRRAS